MIKETSYICSYCGAKHATESYAKSCEERHKKTMYLDKTIYDEDSAYPTGLHMRFADGKRICYVAEAFLEDAIPCGNECISADHIFTVKENGGKGASQEAEDSEESVVSDDFKNYTGNFFIDQAFCWLGLYPEENFFLKEDFGMYKISEGLEIFRFDYLTKRWKKADSDIILGILKHDIVIRAHESQEKYSKHLDAYYKAEEEYLEMRKGGKF